MADAADRTLPATPRRREAARRAGMMPAAALPAWAAGAVTALVLLPAWARATLPAAADMVGAAIRGAGAPQAEPLAWPSVMPVALVLPTIGLVLASAGAALAVRLLLDGLSWDARRLAPDLQRVDPLAGLRRVLSWDTLGAVVGNGLGLGGLAAATTLATGPLIALLSAAAGPAAVPQAWAAASHVLLALVAAAAAVAVAHWGLARLRFERRIRMTPQEFAAEAKSMQADPKVRLLQQQRRRPTG
jgi:flagellar biosynthetic protein FlhB